MNLRRNGGRPNPTLMVTLMFLLMPMLMLTLRNHLKLTRRSYRYLATHLKFLLTQQAPLMLTQGHLLHCLLTLNLFTLQ